MTGHRYRGLTLFTTPKPFRNHVGVIQRNAIESWCRLHPRPEIILFGNDEGMAEAGMAFGIAHIADVARNEHGTPLVSALFEKAEALSHSEVLGYVNADIVLLADFLAAVERVSILGKFLMVGRRVDVDVREALDFDRPEWEEHIRRLAERDGALHAVTGIDYFVYSRGLWGEIPPFAIGRSAWDNWLIYRARVLGVPVVDVTRTVTAIHQNHDYQHHPLGEAGVWQGVEAQRNQEMAGGPRRAFTLADATHVLTPSGIRPALSMTHLKRRVLTVPLFFPGLAPLVNPLVQIARKVRRLAQETAELANTNRSSRE